jgi:hypothetical protein
MEPASSSYALAQLLHAGFILLLILSKDRGIGLALQYYIYGIFYLVTIKKIFLTGIICLLQDFLYLCTL